MARVVKKFGGTSVADLERIRAVATRVKEAVDQGDQVVVVVSAPTQILPRASSAGADTRPCYSNSHLRPPDFGSTAYKDPSALLA